MVIRKADVAVDAIRLQQQLPTKPIAPAAPEAQKPAGFRAPAPNPAAQQAAREVFRSRVPQALVLGGIVPAPAAAPTAAQRPARGLQDNAPAAAAAPAAPAAAPAAAAPASPPPTSGRPDTSAAGGRGPTMRGLDAFDGGGYSPGGFDPFASTTFGSTTFGTSDPFGSTYGSNPFGTGSVFGTGADFGLGGSSYTGISYTDPFNPGYSSAGGAFDGASYSGVQFGQFDDVFGVDRTGTGLNPDFTTSWPSGSNDFQLTAPNFNYPRALAAFSALQGSSLFKKPRAED